MNIANRIIIIVILLVIIAVSFLAIVNEFAGFFNWSDIASRLFDPDTNLPAWASTLALLFIIALCCYFLYLELRKRRVKIAKVRNVKSGKAMITLDTISSQIKNDVLGIEGLKNLKVDVVPKSGGVVINMLAELVQSKNIPEKTSEIIEIAEQTAKEKLDIRVIDTNVTVTNLIREETSLKDTGPVIPGVATQPIIEAKGSGSPDEPEPEK